MQFTDHFTCLRQCRGPNSTAVHLLTCLYHMAMVSMSTVHRLTCLSSNSDGQYIYSSLSHLSSSHADGQTLLQFTFSPVFITYRWSNLVTVHRLTCLHHIPMVKPCYSSPAHLSSSHANGQTFLQFTVSPVFITCQWSNLVTVHLLTCLHHIPMVKPCYSSPSHLSSSPAMVKLTLLQFMFSPVFITC